MFSSARRVLSLSLAISLLMIASTHAADRTWIGGNVDWVDGGLATNWNPNDEPDSDDVAIFNSANTVNLGSNNAIMGLTLSGGIDLFTSDFDLTVDGLVQVSGAGTNLFLGGAASAITADDVTINADGTIELTGGLLTLDEEVGTSLIDINVGGSLQGNGVISFVDTPGVITTVLVNDGDLTALSRGLTILSPPPVGTLHINTASGTFTRVDLDGAGEAGVVNVNRNQTLDLNVGFADAFNGTMNLFHESTFDSLNAWTLAGGSIAANNGFVDNPLPTPDVSAGTAFIKGGLLTQTGGTISVVDTDGTLQFDAAFTMNGGTFLNEGHTIFNNTTTINNAATFTMGTSGSDLTVGANASVTIHQASFNLDGNGPGTVITVNQGGVLTLDLGDYDNDAVTNGFDAVATLNGGQINALVSDAEFVMNGTLNMSNAGGQAANWTGDPIDIGNDSVALSAHLNVSGTGSVSISSQVDFNSDADVDIAAGTTLVLGNATVNFDTVNGGNNAEFTGAGTISFNGIVNVNEAVTLNMVGGTVDLDGTDGSGETINIDAPLTINVATMSSFGRVNGVGVNTLDVNNSVGTGVLTVNLDNASAEWTLNGPGVMNLVNDNIEATLLAGSDVNINGTVNVTGDVRTTARLDIAGVININTVGQPLRLAAGGNSVDTNTIAGGTINGPGLIAADNARALHGFGTINADIDFDGLANLRADNGMLTINGTIIDVNVVGTADVDGILNIPAAWNTTGAPGGSIQDVSLLGGTLQGGTITNDNGNGILGFGMVTSRVINNTELMGFTLGGTLIFQTVGNDNDWDGAAGAGELTANGGAVLELRDVGAAFGFTGTVTAGPGGRVFANGFALDFNPGSSLNLTQGTYESTSSTDIGGTVTIGAGPASTIKVENNFFLTFETGSSTTLNGNVNLINNNIIIEQGATFGGAGAIVIPDGSHVVGENLANIGVLFDMQGAFRPGNSEGIGRVDIFDYQQAGTSELFVEITGTSLNQFDRLVVSGAAIVDGFLSIDIDGGFVPAVGNTFNIITASNVSGTFDYWDISGMPAGLTFAVKHLANAVQLEVVNAAFFSADFDNDGDVDLSDYVIWQGAFNLNQLGDANGDNITDLADWSLWRDQLGSTTGPGGVPQPVPEPGAIALALAALAMVGAARRMRRPIVSKLHRAAWCLIGLIALQSAASAAPLLTVVSGGIVGGNRQWLVRVAPDAALFTGGTGPVGAELALEVTAGELLSATKNGVDWPYDLPRKNSPFGLTTGSGLDVNLASDTVFAPLGSNLFNSGATVTVLTIVTQGIGLTTLSWGGYNITAASPDYISCRLAQNGISFDGLQGSLTVVPGDFDSDGDVDGADFVIWQTNFPAANGHNLSTGDADGDGDVDGADFVVWQTNFPFTPGPGAAPVPEPSMWTLALAALGCVSPIGFGFQRPRLVKWP